MEVWWDVHEENLDAILEFKAIRDFREEIKKSIEHAAHEAGAYMATHVPFHSGQLYNAINVGPVTYMPGGAGGGGRYEVLVGVDRDRAPHAEFVIEGTGLYNRENPKNGIYSNTPGGVMAFEKFGEMVFTRYTRGQHPQREWFEDAQELARDLIEYSIRTGIR
jgi:hypothetical protein